jgi:simple sugar transport system permease protein
MSGEIELALTALRIATPLVFVALGVLIAERAGILLMGVEGAMLVGAFAGMLGTFVSGDPWLGVLWGVLFGLIAGFALAVVTVWLPADQIVMGLAFNIACAGVTSFAFRVTAAKTQKLTPQLSLPDWLSAIPGVPALAAIPPLAWLALVLSALVWFFLYRTGPGLILRSAGHSTHAARAAGADIKLLRGAALTAAGALSGLGGAALTVGWVRSFNDEITLGRGFIALAAVYFARWHPGWTLLTCLLFGAGEALAFRAQGLGGNPHIYLMVPYLLTLLVVGVTGRARAPQEAGRPYFGS